MIKTKVFTAIISWLLLSTIVSGCGGPSPSTIMRTVVSEKLVTQIIDELPSSHGPSVGYSPDGRRIAYLAVRGGKEYFVVDGVSDDRGYDRIEIGYDMFSTDSKRVAYLAVNYGENRRTDQKWFVVIDGEEGDAYSSAGGFIFSPDSKHVAYTADGLVFLDRVRVSPEGTVRSNPLFSPDSQHLAYIVERSGGGKSVVLDGIPGKPYGLLGTMAFSPDGKHLAYRAMIGNTRWVIVVDGEEVSQYESNEWHLRDIAFSPDSSHLAYVAGENFRSPDHRQFVVLDGKELTRHKNSISWRIIFSPDGKRMAYGCDDFIVVDGAENAVHSNLSIESFVFSPDSTRHAYRDIKTGWWANITGAWVVVDGVKGKTYDGVSGIIFSPDSKHVAYHASKGKKGLVIVDEVSKEYDKVGKIVWDSADRFHYLAWKGNSIYLVEETVTER